MNHISDYTKQRIFNHRKQTDINPELTECPILFMAHQDL